MSNYYFDVDIHLDVCIPLDQVMDSEGNYVDSSYSKEEIKQALRDEIAFATRIYFEDNEDLPLKVDEKELEQATSLFYDS